MDWKYFFTSFFTWVLDWRTDALHGVHITISCNFSSFSIIIYHNFISFSLHLFLWVCDYFVPVLSLIHSTPDISSTLSLSLSIIHYFSTYSHIPPFHVSPGHIPHSHFPSCSLFSPPPPFHTYTHSHIPFPWSHAILSFTNIVHHIHITLCTCSRPAPLHTSRT